MSLTNYVLSNTLDAILWIKDWVFVNSALMIAVASWFVSWNIWRENRRSNRIKIKPNIILVEKHFFVLKESDNSEEIIVSEDQRLGHVKSTIFGSVEVLNAGMGNAFNLNLNCCYEYEKLLSLFSQLNSKRYEIEINRFENMPVFIGLKDKINGQKLSTLLDTNNEIDSLYSHVLPIHLIKDQNAVDQFLFNTNIIKANYLYLLAKHNIDIDGIEYTPIDSSDLPKIEITAIYKDVANNKYKDKFTITLQTFDYMKVAPSMISFYFELEK